MTRRQVITTETVSVTNTMKTIHNTLILGGAKSGKSRYALLRGQQIIDMGPRGKGLFVATATASDDEMAERIKRHKEERGGQWVTVEQPLEIDEAVRRYDGEFDVIIVDCLTLWLNNIMFREMDADDCIKDAISAMTFASTPVILVSNEVGHGIVPADRSARTYRDIAGRMNQAFASACEEVVMVVAGLPLVLKAPATVTHTP
jgi:adenosylcobinamide kinase/adenosylcobinamide-phosphate guanylyltransferase